MPDEHREPRFSSPDAVDITEYPRVNRAAVIALLLGILSVSALANPVLCFLSLIGIALAIVALRSIARSDEAVVGRRAAIIGLLLSLLFITWAPCRYFVRHEVLYRQARKHGEYFLSLVHEGRLHEAHQLTEKKHHRQPPNANLNQVYRDSKELSEAFESFCQKPPVRKITALNGKGRIRFVSRRDIEFSKPVGSTMDIVTEEFAIVGEEDGQARSLPVVVGIARTRYIGTDEAHWSVQGIDDPRRLDD